MWSVRRAPWSVLPCLFVVYWKERLSLSVLCSFSLRFLLLSLLSLLLLSILSLLYEPRILAHSLTSNSPFNPTCAVHSKAVQSVVVSSVSRSEICGMAGKQDMGEWKDGNEEESRRRVILNGLMRRSSRKEKGRRRRRRKEKGRKKAELNELFDWNPDFHLLPLSTSFSNLSLLFNPSPYCWPSDINLSFFNIISITSVPSLPHFSHQEVSRR